MHQAVRGVAHGPRPESRLPFHPGHGRRSIGRRPACRAGFLRPRWREWAQEGSPPRRDVVRSSRREHGPGDFRSVAWPVPLNPAGGVHRFGQVLAARETVGPVRCIRNLRCHVDDHQPGDPCRSVASEVFQRDGRPHRPADERDGCQPQFAQKPRQVVGKPRHRRRRPANAPVAMAVQVRNDDPESCGRQCLLSREERTIDRPSVQEDQSRSRADVGQGGEAGLISHAPLSRRP
ncbi:MAG: hypothetical protein FD152_3504 [Xanthobacteraceae bacterium]|nr:MAG: hypothetical protein FD152_3504 [Xanthobacteraceae bacterium]